MSFDRYFSSGETISDCIIRLFRSISRTSSRVSRWTDSSSAGSKTSFVQWHYLWDKWSGCREPLLPWEHALYVSSSTGSNHSFDCSPPVATWVV